MKKIIGLLLVVIMLAGCGVTQKATDGSDGSDGTSGQDGRDYITPVIRPYTWDSTNTVLTFQDCGTITKPTLYNIGFSEQASGNNYIVIKVPAGWQGHTIQAVLNGKISKEMTIPLNTADYMVFFTTAGTDYGYGTYMNIDKLDRESKNSYFTWYLDGSQVDLYFADSFKE